MTEVYLIFAPVVPERLRRFLNAELPLDRLDFTGLTIDTGWKGDGYEGVQDNTG